MERRGSSAAPRGHGRTAVERSPYDASRELLDSLLPPAAGDRRVRARGRNEPSAGDDFVAWLPTLKGCPLGSSPLLAEPPRDVSRATLAPWLVAAQPLSVEQAIELLPACAGARMLVPGVLVGPDLSFAADLFRFAATLVAREQFLPSLRTARSASGQDEGRWEARWNAVVAGGDVRRLASLVERMPDACRALGTSQREPPALPASEVAHQFLDYAVDAIVRLAQPASTAAGLAVVASRRGPSRDVLAAFDSLHDAWLHALTSRNADVAGEPEELARLSTTIREWQHPVLALETAPFRLAFRLEEPLQTDDQDDECFETDATAGASLDHHGASPWTVRYLLQSVTDPSLLVPAASVWAGGRDPAKVLGRGFDARAHMLRSLGQAASLVAAVDASLGAPQPAGFETDVDGAFAFLTEGAWTLQQAGYGVILPGWWTRKGARARLSLRAQVKNEPQSAAMLSLNTILDVDWRAALGDQVLTRAELEALARFKAPLVRLRGQWVQVTEADRQRALDFLKKGRSARLTAGDLMRLGLGGGLGSVPVPGDLPVTGIDATGGFDDLLRQVHAHVPATELPEPAGFAGTLRPYQARGFSWLSFLGAWGLGACLADDMGLGKTVQALALVQRDCQQGRHKPVLLVCPVSIVGNWQKEASRFTPSLPVLVHHGGARVRDASFREQTSRHAIVICSYSLLHRDLELLASVPWRGVILDEAQNIKNPDTAQARAARALEAEYRIALTGTPVENGVNDLWSIMEFLNPGFLGSRASFRDQFLLPIKTGTDPAAADRLKRLTGPFVLRRMKTDRTIISDLPDKQEMKVYCTLTREQASLYRAVAGEAERELRKASGIARKGVVLATLSKLKQVCNHPAQFLGDGSPLPGRSGKLARLTEMLDEVAAEGERALVFTQFAEMGTLLERHLEASFGRDVLFLHGGVPQAQRDRIVTRFQSGQDEAFVFVLSLKAGGTGLNLTAANHVFMFDRWWNPAVENQAIDRAFRIGQTRRVQVHKFLCAGTLEERIDEMLERKQEVASRVVGAGEAWLTELSTSELRELFALRAELVGE